MMKHIYIIFLILPFLQSCKKNDPIEKVATFQFRNLYEDEQPLTPNQLERLRNSNPQCYTIRPDYQKMFNRLNDLQVINNNGLQLQKLWFFSPQDNPGVTVETNEYCRIFYDENAGYRILEVKANGKTLQIPILNNLPTLTYGYADIIEGGENEILVLSWYDVPKGRNYDLDIYKVK